MSKTDQQATKPDANSSAAANEQSPPQPRGAENQNPDDIGMCALLKEDFDTYEHDLLDPCLWAIAVHRFGNWRMGVKSKVVRAPLSVAYRAMHRALVLGPGIHLDYTVKLGRRVRLWHHGGVFVNAKSIGNDVHLRHNVSVGIASRKDPHGIPTIEDGVDIYAGACIAGNVTVGANSVVGPNSVVITDVPPNTTVLGNPARRVPMQ